MKRQYSKKPPARQRYERNNPVESSRVSKELHDRLQAVKEAEGKSTADVLKIGVGLLELKMRKEGEIWQQAYDEGWEKGVNTAEELYAVKYRCSDCGKEMVVTTDKEKKAIREYMREHGWHHGDCNDPDF